MFLFLFCALYYKSFMMFLWLGGDAEVVFARLQDYEFIFVCEINK